jgi:hypothetical protein
MKTSKKVLVLASMLLLAACATNPNKAVNLDTRVDNMTTMSQDSVIGVKGGNMVYQKKVILGEVLHNIQIEAYQAEATLYGGPRYYDNRGLIGALKECKEETSVLSDGKIQWTEKRDYVIPEYESIKMGLDETGLLAGVTEEFLRDRIDRFREYKTNLNNRTDAMNEKIAECKVNLAYTKKQQRSVANQEQ